MDQNLKNMLKSASVQKIRELLEKHVDEIQINTKEKQVIIMIDKKYSLNQLCGAEHISGIIDTVEKAFGVEYDMVLKVTHHIKED